ncbi:MAG: DUF4271 domain-containing protein [Chryseolinea sp.]
MTRLTPAKAFIFFFLSLVITSQAQELTLKKDFRNDWLIYESDVYRPFNENEEETKSVYFWMEVSKFSSDSLIIESTESFALFVNAQLIYLSETKIVLSVDSLQSLFNTPDLLIGIYQENGIDGGLTTGILSRTVVSSSDLIPISFSSFRDFVIAGMLILLMMLIVIIQLNPKLATDYFSVTKIFSLREGDDKQVYSRITSSTSILFYCFCSLIIGYYLIIIFHFIPTQYSLATAFYANTFSSALLQWLQLSLIILGFFFLKILIVFVATFLFGYSDLMGIHFFNWVRLLLVIFGTLTVILFIYFISHGQGKGFLATLFVFVAWILVGWMILIFLKLMTRNSRSMFHLFSYLCATELIPFLLTINLLY